MKLNPRLPRQK